MMLPSRNLTLAGRRRKAKALAAAFTLAMLSGCASPGPPHAPSLNLPKIPGDLTVMRTGDRVTLRFTAPSRTTDNLPLPNLPIRGALCRQLDRKTCAVVGGMRNVEPSRPNSQSVVLWEDVLPPELAAGAPRLLGYRVELFSRAMQSAGRSDAAYTVAGGPPSAVDGLQAEGTRAGVLLHWKPAPDAGLPISLSREDLTAPAKPSGGKREGTASNIAELEVTAADAAQGRVLDATARPEHAYRYIAERRTTVQLGGRALELSSAPSPAVTFTLHLVYPPPAPTGLTVAGFTTEATATVPAGFAVDLIWQPVDDAGLLAGLAGYNVYREGHGGRMRLTAEPVQVPAFHDATASATERYGYSVTAVDGKGNESAAATAVLGPDARP